jgi:hypothetical protein
MILIDSRNEKKVLIDPRRKEKEKKLWLKKKEGKHNPDRSKGEKKRKKRSWLILNVKRRGNHNPDQF